MRRSSLKNKFLKKYSWLAIIFLVALIFIIVDGQNVYAEWLEPSSPPPTEKFYAPLTTTGEPQSKEGYLLIDPENYHPTKTSSLGFSVNSPLVVGGEGSKFSTPFVYSDKLVVDTDTLYVDSLNEWVGIGVDNPSTERLKINGLVQVGTGTLPINSRAVSSYSNDDFGIYSYADTNSSAAVYGLRASSDGWAVMGESQGANVGVRGESDSGAGIYATTNSSTNGAVYGSNDDSGFAGYFDGNLGSVSDMVAKRFLPTGLQRSLISFTSGQKIGEYEFGTWSGARKSADMVFDGSYIWSLTVADDNGNSLFKIRASDGALINSYDIGYTSSVFGLIFDGQDLWFVYNNGSLAKFNPIAESISTYNIGLIDGLPSKSLAISEENGSYYLWAYKESTIDTEEAIIKINITDGTVVDTYLIDDLFGTDVDDPNGIVFDGDYIWISAESGYLAGAWAEDPTNADHPVRIFDTLVSGEYNCVPDGLEFDGEYIWCMTGLGANQTLMRIWAEDPTNSQHPAENVGEDIPITTGIPDILDNIKAGVFDGTYFWVIDQDDNNLYRFLMADIAQYQVFDLPFQSDEIIFDGTYFWLAEVDGSRLHKYYSGIGMGYTDLSSVVNLDPVSSQPGSINISGSSNLGTDITVGTDVDIANNVWGGASDEIIDVTAGVANCSDGLFVKGVELDSNNKISKIYCREL